MKWVHTGEPSVAGWVDRSFAAVADALAANVAIGDDVGACLAVFRHGAPVVDLHVGTWSSTDARPYPSDALSVGYSVTKGVTGLVLASVVDEGALDLDAPVVRYWPEFGAGGKDTVSVRQMASHQAGLSMFRDDVGIEQLADWDLCVAALARQEPAWTPGQGHGYHAVTLGYLVGEVIRRVTGRTVGQLLRERFNLDGELQAWIGLPPSEHHRVVPSFDAPSTSVTPSPVEIASMTPGTITHRTFNNPAISIDAFQGRELWQAEIPGANGIFSARALAQLYSSVVDGPLRQISVATVEDMRAVRAAGPDLVLVDQDTRFGTVFQLASPREPMLGPGSFGHSGMGGSLAFADPGTGVAFAYLPNRAVHEPTPHSRVTSLIAAVVDSLG